MFNIKMIGYEKTLAKMYGIEVGLIDMTIPHKLMLKHKQEEFKKLFEKGDPSWDALSKTTLKLREVNKRNQPLVDRGNLMRALSSPRSRYAKHKVFKKSFRIAISSTLRGDDGAFYPAIMEKGANIKNGWGKGISIKIPGRPYMHFTNDDRTANKKIMHMYLEALVNA